MGGQDSLRSELGISYEQIYDYIAANLSDSTFSSKFTPSDLTFTVHYHSSSPTGLLSFTDFNQMVLPSESMKLRAKAT